MRTYECDVCGLSFNEYGYFKGGDPCKMYELKPILDHVDGGSSTYDGDIICQRCYEKMRVNKFEKSKSDGFVR